MTKKMFVAMTVLSVAMAAPAAAQFGNLGSKLGKASKVVEKVQELKISDAEEADLGAQISAKLRDKYGVVQDRAVHRYVTLVGSVLAAESARPNLKWTFIVLDTDGINAFAAPGGFIHITRGALALIQDEAQLADVLGHEIGHVTAKHTVNAIQNAKRVEVGGELARKDVLGQLVDRAYSMILENQFDRNQEMEADRLGVTLANRVGYQPAGLGEFLRRLATRNANLKEPSGMFASHPDSQARLDALKKLIASSRLTATATVAPRYAQNVDFTLAPIASLGETASAPAQKTSGGLGLGGLKAIGREKSSDQTVSSAGSRGVNPDRDAKGGPVKTLVAVAVSKAEVAEFRKGIAG
jgi:predicted Zn-dependent protease